MLSKNIFKYGIIPISFYIIYLSKNTESKNLRMGIAGLLAQASTDILFHPLDLINTRTKFYFSEKVNAYDMGRRIINTTGYSGLFRGGSITLIGSCLSGFLYYSSYKKLKEVFSKYFEGEENMTYVVYTLSNIISEFWIYPLYYPIDMIRTRIQTGQFAYKNFFHGIRKILKNSTKKGLLKITEFYMGFLPSFIFSLSSVFLTLFTFEITRDYFAKKNNITAEEIKGMEYFLCSFIAGFVSSSSLNFLEVYSIQKMVHGNKVSFLKFLAPKNLYALKSGLISRLVAGNFYVVFLLESLNFYGKIFDTNF